mmetsp:Transcript_5146/g.14795  ORF Transcript_5146/g.14795 Transcript_5146/m.14795 type:complete len:540 (-) Transcript_5146:595-2214(-)
MALSIETHPAITRSGSPTLGGHGLFAPNRDASSLLRFPLSKLKLDNLFLLWLAIPDSQKLVLTLLESAKNGQPLPGPTSSVALPTSAAALTQMPSQPPLSPLKGRHMGSPIVMPRRIESSRQRQGTGPETIPRFYFPRSERMASDALAVMHAKMDTLFSIYPDGLTIPAMKELIKEVFELPTVLAYPLFYKLVVPDESLVTREAMAAWVQSVGLLTLDPHTRMMEVLAQKGASAVTQADLKSMMAGILLSHPGLEFLQDTPEFQDRYAETVIYRIFYALDRCGAGRLSLRDLKRGDLLGTLQMLDEEEDINKVLNFFSYEHFYVIYCKFWELDTDHDFFVTKEDLLRYGNHSLTYRIVDRIFSQAARPFASAVEGKMSYEDFVWFILSEEDKSSDVSLDYWFRCVDLDCDGCLQPNEMLYFYEEQLHRMECLAQEPVLFEDVLCQVHDMVQPAKEGSFTLRDLKRQRPLAGTLFNILFNLNKFIAFETRDPFIIRQEREDAALSEWDRFARTEYVRLAMEEEGEADLADFPSENEVFAA